MKKFIMLVGLQGCGKSTYAQKFLNNNPSFVYINLDVIHKERTGEYSKNNGEDLEIASQAMQRAMKEGQSVILDAANCKYTKRKHFSSMFKKNKYEIEIIYFNTSVEQCFQNVLKREAEGGHFVPEYHIQKFYTWLNFPLINEADTITILSNESKNVEASVWFESSLDLLKMNPYEWAEKNIQQIEKFIPELYVTKGFMQYNRHTLDVFTHLIKTTLNVTKKTNNVLLILASLLHDIGKYKTRRFITKYEDDGFEVLNGIELIELDYTDIARIRPLNGKFQDTKNVHVTELPYIRGSFFGHENVSSKLAYNICIRLGYSFEDSLYVANLVQLHMDMPIEKEDTTDLKIRNKWANYKNKCDIFLEDLAVLRFGDANGK